MKEHETDHIKDKFKTAFNSFEATPSGDVWDGIADRLKQRKRILMWKNIGVAASLLALLTTSLWFVFVEPISRPVVSEMIDSDNHTALTKTSDTEKLSTIKDSGDDEIINTGSTTTTKFIDSGADNELPAIANLKADSHVPSVPRADQLNDKLQDLPSKDLALITPEAANEMMEDAPPRITQEVAENLHPQGDPIIPPDRNDDFDEDFIVKKDKEKRWQLALGYGTFEGLDISKSDLALSPNKARFDNNSYTANLSFETAEFSDIENTIHLQPFTLGISFSRMLNHRLSAESGLLFTRLGSTSKTYRENEEWTEYKNHIVYLGIPAAIRYHIINGKRLGLYFAQGIVLEKGISAVFQTSQYNSGRLEGGSSGKIDIRGVQLSLITSAGVDVKLLRNFSLYVQPGIQIFLLNNTQPFNIRSARSSWPAIQTGIRMHL